MIHCSPEFEVGGGIGNGRYILLFGRVGHVGRFCAEKRGVPIVQSSGCLSRMKRNFQNQPCIAEILGVKVNLVDYAETIVAMEDAISNRSQLTITFINVHSIMTAQKDEEFRANESGQALIID